MCVLGLKVNKRITPLFSRPERAQRLRQETNMRTEAEYKRALMVAADALDIAADWNVENVQVDPPKDWHLPAYGEDPDDGWCSTRALAQMLRNLCLTPR